MDKKASTQSAAAKAYDAECQATIEDVKVRLAQLEAHEGDSKNGIASVLQPYNEMMMALDHGVNKAGLLRNVHPDEGVRDRADACEQDLQKLATDIDLSRPIYDGISAMDLSSEDPVTKRHVAHLIRDFRRAGVDKDEATRANVRKLQEELVIIGQDFGKNIREDVRSISLDSKEELAGLPEDYVAKHAPGEDGKIKITTDYPDYIPFMTYAKSDGRRLDLYKQFRSRGYPKNRDVLNQLLAKRHELATLLGYDNWAVYITEDKMIKTAGAARTFIDKVAGLSKKRAERDRDELLAWLKTQDPKATKVGDWQKTFIEEAVKKEKYAFDSQAVRQYFSYAKTRDGLFALVSRLFGVTIVPVEAPAEAEVWHPSVAAYDLRDGDEKIGRFYLDMHPREDKYKHAAAFPIYTGVEGVQEPEAALVCNFPAEGPMEHDQVETFFHEFGHLIHHLFGGDHRWVGVSGFNTEWDFVEAPSQLLEEWAWEAATLKTFATNKAGEPIPDDLIAAMRKARDFGKGLWVAQQMFYASVSLNYYDRDPTGLDPSALMRELQVRYAPFDYVEDTHFHLSFGHLDGYSAIYYTYMWSLVIAKDMFSRFEKEGVTNPDVAGQYRKHVLAPGGSKDAAVMVRDFLGRDYEFTSFGEWLNQGG